MKLLELFTESSDSILWKKITAKEETCHAIYTGNDISCFYPRITSLIQSLAWLNQNWIRFLLFFLAPDRWRFHQYACYFNSMVEWLLTAAGSTCYLTYYLIVCFSLMLVWNRYLINVISFLWLTLWMQQPIQILTRMVWFILFLWCFYSHSKVVP